jgi:WD40 repeat protein
MVALSLDAWKPGAVQSAVVEVPVQVLEVAPSPQLAATLKGQDERVGQVAWAPDGKTLASLSSGKSEVKLWDVAQRKERATLRSDLGNNFELAFTPDGKTLAVSHYKPDAKTGPTGGISLWDVATGQHKGLLQHTPPRGVTSMVLSADGKTAAALEVWQEAARGPTKRALTLWDIAAGKALSSLPADLSTDLAFSPDGRVLARVVYHIKDKRLDAVEIRRRDVATNQDLPALVPPGGKSRLHGLAFAPDGRTLAAADYEGHVLLWDTASARLRATLHQEDGWRIASLAFSPDGRLLAAALGEPGGRDHVPGMIALWDVATGQRRCLLAGHTDAVTAVAFSPDGKLLASGSADRTVRLWEMTALPATTATYSGR